jgi:hypothetical protein
MIDRKLESDSTVAVSHGKSCVIYAAGIHVDIRGRIYRRRHSVLPCYH